MPIPSQLQRSEAPPTEAPPPEAPAAEEEPLRFVERLQNFFTDLEKAFNGVDAEAGITALVILLVTCVLTVISSKLVRRLAKREAHSTTLWRYLLHAAATPIALAIFTIGLVIASQTLGAAVIAALVLRISDMLVILAVFWFLFAAMGYVDVLTERLARARDSQVVREFGPVLRRVLRLGVIVLAFLVFAESVLHLSIGALLAGFGVVGLALSLAAQDSLKNVFGAITIFFDQPYKVGQRIVFGGYDGVVEDIGFRSTRVRTLTGHLVTIPNSKIANESVENIGRRPYIRRLEWIRLPFDTPWEQVDEAVQVIRDVLEEPELAEPIHPTIGTDAFPPRVNFFGFHEYGYQIIVLYWFTPPAYWDYLAHGEKVNLRIVEEFHQRGIRFAMPPRALYHQAGTGNDAAEGDGEPSPPPPA